MNIILSTVGYFIHAFTGLNVAEDQLTFLVALYIALSTSYIYKWYIQFSYLQVKYKLSFLGLSGIWLLYFIWGWNFLFALVEVTVCYVLMIYLPSQSSKRYVFVFAMGTLSIAHAYNVYERLISNNKDIAADFTGPVMIITQRVTSLSFSLSDGAVKEESLTENQKRSAIKKTPTFYEYFAYMFSVFGIMAGPLVFFNDFIKCTQEESKYYNEKDTKKSASPSPNRAVLSKVITSMMMIVIYWLGSKTWHYQKNVDPTFIESTPVWQRFLYLYGSLFVSRAKYYGVWLFADAVHNVAGIGFSGYCEDGKPQWELISNINILNIEMATGLKTYIDNWNITTVKWIRLVAYDRLSTKYRTWACFMLSAFWHGFFPGYYMMFLTCHVYLLVQRKARRVIRPNFQTSRNLRILYEVVTLFITQITIAYSVLPFVILEWTASIRFYKSVWFVGHVIGLVLLLVLPSGKPPVKSQNGHRDHRYQLVGKEVIESKTALAAGLSQNGHNHVRQR
ncbi:unnamed protein product [Clavelina lepadiformis]|uniref:Uncharacterized protein n=1 Tax=Clavelina lepadiformis TaxID=159417 RepID=A0ABP0GYG1_CLALP